MINLLRVIGAFLLKIRMLIVVVLAIGLPAYIYLAFVAKEPVFPPEQDVALGRMSEMSIAEDPEEYPLLAEDEYPEAYAHLRRIVGGIIDSPEIRYRDIFAYDKMRIIDRDDVLNAFCTPGGYIYVYTGLIRYLDAEDHLAGVIGHEIAHAELRHSSTRLQREYGVKALLGFVILSSPMSIRDVVHAEILRELSALKYGRGQEADADAHSVRYLATSPYACDGAAGFFVKLLESGDNLVVPEFLSSHPDSAARVQHIQGLSEEVGCITALGSQTDWLAFQQSLPEQSPPAEPDSSRDEGDAGSNSFRQE